MARKGFLLLLLLIITCPGAPPAGTVPAEAQGPVLALVAPSSPQFATGTIEVQVVITGALSLGSFEFDLEYDPSLVAIDGLAAQGFLGQGAGCDPHGSRCAVTLGPLNQGNASSMGAYTYGSGPGATGDGVLALLQLLPTGEGGSLLLDLTDALITDIDANPAVPTTQDVTLTLEPAYPLYLPLVSASLPSTAQLSGSDCPAIRPQHIAIARSLSGGERVAEEACLDFAYPAGVGAEDMELAAAHWREQSSDPGWEGRFDLNGDEAVDVVDVMQVAADWSTLCLPYTTTTVGPAGGSLQVDGLSVVIPPGLLSESIVITATEVPSQTAEVAADLDPAGFHPLEPGFELIAPIASDDPITVTLSYEATDIPAGFDPQNLGVLLRTDPLMENPGGEQPQEIPEVVFCPLPASVEEGTRQVQMDIHMGGAYQLVAMATPLDVVLGPAITDTLTASPDGPIDVQQTFPANPFRIIWIDEPSGIDKAAFETQVFAGLNAAFKEFTLQRGFPAPVAQVTVVIRRINKPNTNAGVAQSNPLIIVADPYKTYDIQSTMAHEYFHVIQFWNSNKASKEGSGGDANRWFSEGTASWAQDEVFDAATDHYVSPTGKRFTIPLNHSVGPEDDTAYETVAFFKWLETKAPGSILDTMLDHLGRTHTSTAPSRVRNTTRAMFLDSLKSLHPDLNFLMFAESALYWKDFDTNETESGDLWYPDQLGGAVDLPAYFRDPAQGRITRLKKGGAGDGYAKRADILYALARHLTADVQIITNSIGSEALSGMLHLQFAATSNPEVDVAIVARQSGTSSVRRVTGLSVQQETITAFGEGSEVIVIPVAPDWDAPDPSSGQVYNLVSAWVEPCGGETKNVTDVYSRLEMYQALAAASPGDTVRVAPGTYHLYAGLWDNIGSYATLVIDKEVTLAGWGPDQTTLFLYGEDGAIWLWLETARVTFRDIRIQSYGNFGFLASGATRVSFCNVFVEFYPARTQWGLQYNPFDAGGLLEVFGTTFSCADCDATGFDISPYSAIEPAVDVYVRGSSISGWNSGIEYCTYDGCGQVNVDAGCANFSNNVADIWRCDDSDCEDICDTVQ